MARRLEDSFVVPKRLEAHHQEDLFEVVRDPKVWRWPPYDASESQGRSGPGPREAISASEAGKERAFATLGTRAGA